MKRLILALIFMSAFVALNAEAKLTKVRWIGGGTAKPKIELLNNGNDWIELKQGDEVGNGATIQTGFNTEATFKCGDSIVVVKPLTRMRIECADDISDGKIKTVLYIDSGQLHNECKPKRNLQLDYQVRGPAITASVRGTKFDIWADGRVDVTEGRVEISDTMTGEVLKMAVPNQPYVPKQQTVNAGGQKEEGGLEPIGVQERATDDTNNYTGINITATRSE